MEQVCRVEDLDISREAAYRRCRPGGPWQRLFPGIVLKHNGPPTRDQLVTTALLRAGPDAQLTGPEACRRYGLKFPPTREVHVLTPKPRRGSGYLVILPASHLPPATELDGFPTAPPSRAIYDACRTTTDQDVITALVASAAQRGVCDPEHLRQELTNHHGSAPLRKLLDDLAQARSVAERDALDLTRKIGLTTEHWNSTVVGPDGTVIARPDAWFDDVALAWEIDSKQFHLDPNSYARTLARNTRYATAGVVVLQTLPTRLRTQPRQVAEELLKAYQAAKARPRPEVRVTPRRPRARC